jgi:hypothetical protein
MCPPRDSYAKPIAQELHARILAALSCTSPLTKSLQPNFWHSDLVHTVAQALATIILKLTVWKHLILKRFSRAV